MRKWDVSLDLEPSIRKISSALQSAVSEKEKPKLSARTRRLLGESHLGRAGGRAVTEVSSRGLALSACK